MANNKIVTFINRSSVKVAEWKIEVGQTIYHGRVLLVYEDDANGKLSKLKSKCVGTVVNLLVKEGDVLNPGDPVLEVQEGCSHPTVISDLCAECGADLQREGVTESNATVPMVHHIPQLKVSQQEAEMIGKADTERLLKDRKLVLLVDLDQTLIHTTHDNIPNNIKDVHHFQLGSSAWYHTRLRPNTGHFLKEMSTYFELHICTFGVRPYAHMVANILDRDQSLFASRILSRDECFSHNSKVANLQALFPNGDELVCIIDDRKDVWNNSPNLIPVKPYVFFTNTGDINDANLPPITKHSEFFAKGVKLTKREVVQDAKIETKELPQNQHPEEFDVEDEDDYLLYLETILKKVHQLFYKVYDKELEGTPHVRWVLEQLRGSVLKGCEIVFSGLVPLHEGIEHSEPYLMAKDLGAVIGKTVSSTTTHVVAAREGTAKLHESKKFPKIKIVNPLWLTSCLYRWEKVDERLFPLVKAENKKSKDGVPLALTFDDVVSMQQEVKAEFSSDSSYSVESVLEEESKKNQIDVVAHPIVADNNINQTLSEDFVEETSEMAGPSKTDISKTDAQSTKDRELKNVDNILKSLSCLKRKPKSVDLGFFKGSNPEALQNFQIPKKVKISENPEVRFIERRSKKPKNVKTLIKVKSEDKSAELLSPNEDNLLRQPLNSHRIRFEQNEKEHSLRINNLYRELKYIDERHRLTLEEHSIRMNYMQIEHETRLTNINREHQAAMKSILGQINQTMSNNPAQYGGYLNHHDEPNT